MKKSIIWILISFTIICIFIVLFIFYKNTENKKQEDIVYGDIDMDAEVIEQVRPHPINKKTHTYGNTYLNLLNDGTFVETDKYYFFVVKYDMEKYLIRMNKNNEEVVRIFCGDIRNLFIVEDWIYGIVNDGLDEYMISMDIDGNNQYFSSRYKNNIRTMQTDGDKIYFTVDQKNIIGMYISTAICQCNMDLSGEQAVKQVEKEMSQVDIIAIKDAKIYFNESYGCKNKVDNFCPIDIKKEQYPVFIEDKITAFNSSICSEIVGEKVEMNSVNMHNDCFYISAYGDKNYLISYNAETNESLYEIYKEKIDKIFEYNDGIIIFSNGKYERIKK